MPEQQTQPKQSQAATETAFQKLLRQPVGYGPQGIEIKDSLDLWRCSNFIKESGIAPKGMETVQSVMIAISMGAELGMKPMSAVQNIAVINGRPSIWGDALLGVVRQSGKFSEPDFKEWDEEVPERGPTAFCQSRRLPDGKTIVRSFSMEDAKKAGLLEKNTPWKTYPGRMRMFRARSWCLRDNFGDVLCGMRASEEQMDCAPAGTEEPPASSLDELADKMTKPAEKPAADPPLDPPTENQVANDTFADQAVLAEGFSERIARAVRIEDINNVEMDIMTYVGTGKLAREQAAGLADLVKGARARIGK